MSTQHVTEPSAKLWAVICLDGSELEPSPGLTSLKELIAKFLANMFMVLGIGPPGMHINEGVEINSLFC